MVKKIDDHIKKAFSDLGFTDKEVQDGCWCLERKIKGELKPIAWIALHKFLERAAQKANIIFDMPTILNLEKNEIALLVNGKKGEFSSWAIGEASDSNLTTTSKNYRWAMTEKRAKDRVILKLLGIAGDVYSEEESDDFKNKPKDDKPAEAPKPSTPRINYNSIINKLQTLNTVEEVKNAKAKTYEALKPTESQLERLEFEFSKREGEIIAKQPLDDSLPEGM